MATFNFKQFSVCDDKCGMKVGTDSVLLGSWACVEGVETIIDLGAGSGLLSLMMAQRVSAAKIVAVEIDADACADAEANTLASPWHNRLLIANEDCNSFVPDSKVDLVISNPPYFDSTLVSPDAKRAKARHSTIAADNASLGAVSALDFAARTLADNGSLAIVTPADKESDYVFEAEMRRLYLRRICKVSAMRDRAPMRVLWQFGRFAGPIEESCLSIRNKDNSYTNEYISLTKDFYLKF